ncbi:MAG: hypothetical protein ACXVAY_01605 [Mucilaginibacter sp.]
MKKIFTIAFCIFSSIAFAQKPCKFETVKSPIGHHDITGIVVSIEAGKCILTKTDTLVKLYYKSSTLTALLIATTIDVNINLENAQFEFSDDLKINSPIEGYATAENRQVLKPHLNSPVFCTVISKSIIEAFLKADSVYIKLFGERGTEGYAMLTKKDMVKIKRALACI